MTKLIAPGRRASFPSALLHPPRRLRRGLTILTIAAAGMAFTGSGALAGKTAERTAFTVTSFTHEQPVQTLEKPKRFRIPSADSYVVFSSLRWRNWGGKRAVAHGKATTCGEGSPCASHTTTLIADQRHGCFGEYWNYFHVTASVVPLYGDGPVELPVEQFPCEKGE